MCTVAIQCAWSVNQASTRHPWDHQRVLLVQQTRSRELPQPILLAASATEVTSTVQALAVRRAHPDSTRMNQGILHAQRLNSKTCHADFTAGRRPMRLPGKMQRTRWTSQWMQ